MLWLARTACTRLALRAFVASALGGMILRLGKRHNIPIIHVVRRQEQVDLVRARGGEFVLNSTDKDFVAQLQVRARTFGSVSHPIWTDSRMQLNAISGCRTDFAMEEVFTAVVK